MIEGSRVRVSIVGVVVLALFCALFARALVPAGRRRDEPRGRGQRQPGAYVSEPAPRGRILDAKGRVLADNRVANVVTIDRRLEPSARKEVVAALAPLLGTTVEEIDERLDDARVSPYTPVPVGVDVPDRHVGVHR